jgi:hypothetical protein
MADEATAAQAQASQVQARQDEILEVKARKTAAKIAFSKQRNLMIRDADRASAEELERMLEKLEDLSDAVLLELNALFALYDDKRAQHRVVEEMEKLEKESSETVSLLGDGFRRERDAAAMREQEDERAKETERREEEYQRMQQELHEMHTRLDQHWQQQQQPRTAAPSA